MTKRIAMWSGPRNISTAMMRSFENRDDCSVVDEPFYAYYLNATGLKHPCYEAVLAAQPTQWSEVATQLTTDACTTPLQYQKHMTQHMLPDMDLAWTESLTHVFLIRDPRRVIASYRRAMPQVTQQDIGIIRQYELYQAFSQRNAQPIPIIDSQDVLENPRGLLTQLCSRLNIEFSDQMLTWPAGPRDTDGVWATHWYANVEQSTGFAKPNQTPEPELTAALAELASDAMPYYQALYQQRLRAT